MSWFKLITDAAVGSVLRPIQPLLKKRVAEFREEENYLTRLCQDRSQDCNELILTFAKALWCSPPYGEGRSAYTTIGFAEREFTSRVQYLHEVPILAEREKPMALGRPYARLADFCDRQVFYMDLLDSGIKHAENLFAEARRKEPYLDKNSWIWERVRTHHHDHHTLICSFEGYIKKECGFDEFLKDVWDHSLIQGALSTNLESGSITRLSSKAWDISPFRG